MAITTIIVEIDEDKLKEWTDYIAEYDHETSKTQPLDLDGLGTPLVARDETLEQVLDLMGNVAGGVALIYGHANPSGLIMRITANANSAQRKYLRGISRAWKAIDEIMKLRSARVFPLAPGKPDEYLINVPAAVALFQDLIRRLRDLDSSLAGRLADPTTVTNRDQADTWFDQWLDLMAKACLAGGLGEMDLRRVARAMQRVRERGFDRVEFRSCNIGKDKENLNALKEFFGVRTVVAPKVTTFYGRAGVNVDSRLPIATLAAQLGGFQGTQFSPPRQQPHPVGVVAIPGAEGAVATGKRNRIFPASGAPEVIMQETQTQPFHFRGRLFATTAAAVTRFLQTNYKPSKTFAQQRSLAVSGLWTAESTGAALPYVLPLEPAYRDFLEISD